MLTIGPQAATCRFESFDFDGAPTLKLRFDPGLRHQQEAISAAVDLFLGMPLANSPFSLSSLAEGQLLITELGVPNPTPMDEATFRREVLANLQRVQERNDIRASEVLDGMHFSVEMETGTGKTYAYLRTAFELNRAYGFTKFVIVVPSVAIREGVLATIRSMGDHLRGLYLQPFDAAVYDSRQLRRVRQFATANTIQILVMNIQAFQKDLEEDDECAGGTANVINRAQDRMSGRRPIEFIQATRPVVIVDEPQNMESDKASAAIERLNPFCTLRYSATHKRTYNLLYRLGPIEAYDRRLVKRIEVASVVADDNLNAAFVRLVRVDPKKMQAQIRVNHGSGPATKQKNIWVKKGDDLSVTSDERQEYANGFIVDDISFRAGAEALDFANGRTVPLGSSSEGFDEDTRRVQVEETIRQHLDKERALQGQGVKVLSLFFLDRVANYRLPGPAEERRLGPIGEWFEQAYSRLSAEPRYAALKLPPVADVHGGYFSGDKKSGWKDTRGTGEGDSDTYDLIMRDKERLLSLDEPLRFIFSHSALREGWDNPNVFQICTLNDSKSTDRKRQEIGRGLRLPVDQHGDRVHDQHVNRLTIIANEAYDDFARSLQQEYEEDTGRRFGIVEPIAFAKLLRPAAVGGDGNQDLGQALSSKAWEHFGREGYIDKEGQILDAFRPSDEHFVLSVPPGFEEIRSQIIEVIAQQQFGSRIGNARKRERVTFKKQVTLDPGFKELWNRISQRTRYRVSLSTEDLVTAAVKAIKEAPPIGPVKIRVRTVALAPERSGLRADGLVDARDYDTERPAMLPDILADLQNETDLTRRTLVRVLTESGRLDDFAKNPQEFITMAGAKINGALRSLMLTGIRYEQIAGAHWEMRRIEEGAEKELERYATRLYKVQNEAKTPFDHVEIDSEVERQFARDLDSNINVKYFLKLPSWFTVDTPVGPYNPDWAIVFGDDAERVYLVRETKSTLEADKRRHDENVKIECAGHHFKAIGVDYRVATSIADAFSLASQEQGSEVGQH